MLYQLPNGRTVEISIEKYLEMSDADIEYLHAYNAGESIDNPFFNSSLEKSPINDMSDSEFEEYIEENLSEIPDVDILDKIQDIDIDEDLFAE